MITDFDEETIDFLCTNKLTFNQFAICLLIFRDDTTTIIKITNEVNVIGDCLIPLGDGKYKTEMDDLIERRFLLRVKEDKKEPYLLDNFRVNDKLKDIFTLNGITQEFFDAYPAKLIVNGVEYPARSCDFDELEEKYIKAIKSNLAKHKEIVRKLTASKERSPYALTGIMKFIGARGWEEIEETFKAKTRGY